MNLAQDLVSLGLAILSDDAARKQLVKGEATVRSEISKLQRTYKKDWKMIFQSQDKDWREMVQENGLEAARNMLGGRRADRGSYELGMYMRRIHLVKITVPVLKEYMIRRTAK